jgi:sporadic carbohydrate cluster 2OG-Fe(II) oxygenase
MTAVPNKLPGIAPPEHGDRETRADFLSPGESDLMSAFLERGHVIVPVDDRPGLDRLRGEIVRLAANHLDIAIVGDPDAFLNGIHERVTIPGLNALRLAVINGLNGAPWVRATYYRLARSALDAVVGNELAMQRRLNLSIQLPADDSSLLAVHADVWDGDSPFEVVVWLPLVDCHDTKGMYLLPPAADARHVSDFGRFRGGSAEDLYRAIEPDLLWPSIAYGDVMVFSQTLMHGNRVNRERETRWSMNCRFKSLLSPYADKRLGEFFEPISMRPATRFGMTYRLPGGFDE